MQRILKCCQVIEIFCILYSSCLSERRTYIVQKHFLDGIQPCTRILSYDLEVVVDDHLAEEAAYSQQHGKVSIDAVAEGQYDDIRRELRKENFYCKS